MGTSYLMTGEQWLSSRVIVRLLLLILAARDKSPPNIVDLEGCPRVNPRLERNVAN